MTETVVKIVVRGALPGDRPQPRNTLTSGYMVGLTGFEPATT
jgi:hypothetical protein